MNRAPQTTLWADERGAAMTEFVLAFPLVLSLFLGLYMLSFMFAAHLIVMRAADAAARAAVVIVPDDPAYYQGGDAEKDTKVKGAARLVALAAPQLEILDVQYNKPSGFAPLTADVSASFDCSAFLASLMCGLDRQVSMHASATLIHQGGHKDR